jgi:hypothetical protein
MGHAAEDDFDPVAERLLQPGRGAVSRSPPDDRVRGHQGQQRDGFFLIQLRVQFPAFLAVAHEGLEGGAERALDRLANRIAPDLARKNIFVIGLLPGPTRGHRT